MLVCGCGTAIKANFYQKKLIIRHSRSCLWRSVKTLCKGRVDACTHMLLKTYGLADVALLVLYGDFSVTRALARSSAQYHIRVIEPTTQTTRLTVQRKQRNSKAGRKQENEFLLRFSFLLFSYTTLSCTQKIKYIWSVTPRSSCRSHLSGTCNLVFVTCFWAQCLATAPYHFSLLFRTFKIPPCIKNLLINIFNKNISGTNCKT